MDLMDHVMNVAGFTLGTFTPEKIRPGYTVTKVEWHGCMATEYRVVDTGEVVRHEMRGRHRGVVVLYDERGTHWEPLDHFRVVNGALEVWS